MPVTSIESFLTLCVINELDHYVYWEVTKKILLSVTNLISVQAQRGNVEVIDPKTCMTKEHRLKTFCIATQYTFYDWCFI